MTEQNTRITLADLLFLGAFTLVIGWFYIGFFSPDPLYVELKGGIFRLISKLVLVVIPLAWAAIVALYIVLRKRGAVSLLFIAFAGCAFGVVVLLLLGSNLYYAMAGGRSATEYHSYLQINPPLFNPAEEHKSSVRIVFLGGSTTAWGNSAGEQWTTSVEKKLTEDSRNGPIKTYNQGREWYTSLHSLINYETNVRPHKPEVLVFMHGINDLMHNADFSYLSNGSYRGDYGNYLGPAINIIKRKSFFAVLSSNFRKVWNASPRTTITPETFVGIDAFKRNVNTILDLAKLDGTRVVLVTEPSIYRPVMEENERKTLEMLNTEAIGEHMQWSLQGAVNGMAAYNSALKEIAAARKIALIDLDAKLPKSLEYFIDDVHYADKGFLRVTEVMTDFASPIREMVKELNKERLQR